jgi:hypothetical protein
MGFSFRSIDPTRSVKKAIKSNIEVWKNPTDFDAHKRAFRDTAKTGTPITSNYRDDRNREQPQQAEQGMDYNACLQQLMSSQRPYEPPPAYQSFSQMFQQRPQEDYSNVTDVYQRGGMANNLLDRYNAMSGVLQQQQAAMVPRPAQQKYPRDYGLPNKRAVMGQQSPYMNFAQLFGGGGNG